MNLGLFPLWDLRGHLSRLQNPLVTDLGGWEYGMGQTVGGSQYQPPWKDNSGPKAGGRRM